MATEVKIPAIPEGETETDTPGLEDPEMPNVEEIELIISAFLSSAVFANV